MHIQLHQCAPNYDFLCNLMVWHLWESRLQGRQIAVTEDSTTLFHPSGSVVQVSRPLIHDVEV